MTRSQALLKRVLCVLLLLTSAGLVTAAALAPAPPAVLPLMVAVCIGGPMVAAWELRSIDGGRRRARDSRALAQLRRHLDELPEIQHPLGL